MNHASKCGLCNGDLQFLHYGVSSHFSEKICLKYDLLKCQTCRHIKTYPAPSVAELEQVYKNRYFYEVHRAISSEKKLRSRQLIKHLTRLDGYNKSILELGCGNGELANSLECAGYEVVGVDLNAPKSTRNRLTFFQVSIEEYLERHTTERFDIVIMSHTLEHLISPDHVVGVIARSVLKLNGYLVVVVPNTESRTARILGKYWGYWQVPVHVNHFSCRSLTLLASSTGLTTVDTKRRGADSLFWILTLMNLLKVQSGRTTLFKLLAVKIFSRLSRYWIFLGDEDLVSVFRVPQEKSNREDVS